MATSLYVSLCLLWAKYMYTVHKINVVFKPVVLLHDVTYHVHVFRVWDTFNNFFFANPVVNIVLIFSMYLC